MRIHSATSSNGNAAILLVGKIPPLQSQKLFDNLRLKTVADYSGRNAADNRIRRNIPGNNRIGADNRAVADCESVHNHDVGANPDVIADGNRPGKDKISLMFRLQLIVPEILKRMRGKKVQRMLAGADGRIAGN